MRDRLRRIRPAAAGGRAGAFLLALALGLAACPAPGVASTEEFSTFDVERLEEDDESFIDHLLLRPPVGWRDEWERAPRAFRTSQGCLTSGQWFLANELKLSVPMGQRARFMLRLDEVANDIHTYDHLDLWFLFPQRLGTVGVMFRPYQDKSRQDFALRWEFGSDSAASQLQLTFGLEDLFNNLWAWRQTRVGGNAEPYERHPWEPAFKAGLRRERWRIEAEGRWLTSSRKRVGTLSYPSERLQTLRGSWGAALIEAEAFGIIWNARTSNRQARSTDRPLDLSSGDARDSRRLWDVEAGGRRALGRTVGLEGRWIYAERTQSRRPPLADQRLRGVDRILQLEANWVARPALTVRLGGLFDRISISRALATGTPGGRNESRAYIGLTARLGRVTVTGVEGIELDPEGYEVWRHHDKGFLLLQTTF